MARDKQLMPLKEEKWVIDILTGFFFFLFQLRLVVKYELKNEKDQPIFCVMLPAQIK